MKIVYETVDFPSVTLCNINPVRVTGVTEYGTQELLVFLTQITPPTVYDNDYKREDKEPDGGLGSNNDTNGSDVETTLSPSKDRKKVIQVKQLLAEFCPFHEIGGSVASFTKWAKSLLFSQTG